MRLLLFDLGILLFLDISNLVERKHVREATVVQLVDHKAEVQGKLIVQVIETEVLILFQISHQINVRDWNIKTISSTFRNIRILSAKYLFEEKDSKY